MLDGLRRLQDSDVGPITALLHLAYRPLLEQGLNFLAATQDDAMTRERTGVGRECWIVGEPEPLGTITLVLPGHGEGTPWYERPDVAIVEQFAVHPDHQREGLGSELLNHAVNRGREVGASNLMLDTSERATELIHWYLRRGFRRIGDAQWSHTNYTSWVLARDLL